MKRALVMLLTCILVSPLAAQDQGKTISLVTKDYVKLNCRYFPSRKGESAIPIVLLHAWKGQGSELLSVAKYLNGNEAGHHAVFVPDLRGHGTSTVREMPDETIKDVTEARKMRRKDFESIVMDDLEAIKRFLMTEHNQRKLNIDMLCVVGVDLGAMAGAYWTVNDWSWPTLAGNRRQGQDVKALVMVSPQLGFKGVSINPAITHPALKQQVAVQILYGQKGKAAAAARRIHTTLDREISVAAGYDFRDFETSLQGLELFTEPTLNVEKYIASFIKAQVADRAEEFKWQPRAKVAAETEQEEKAQR